MYLVLLNNLRQTSYVRQLAVMRLVNTKYIIRYVTGRLFILLSSILWFIEQSYLQITHIT